MISKRMVRRRTIASPVEEETLSVPDFNFVEFVGLDGFDPSTCSWTSVDLNCEDRFGSCEHEEIMSEGGKYKSFQIHSKKTIACSNDQKSKKTHVHIPSIKTVRKSGRKNRGRLVYDESAVTSETDDLNFQRKLDRIKVFGGERSEHSSPCNLPPLNSGSARRSNSANKLCTFQSSSSKDNNRIPWQGPNSKGIYSTSNFRDNCRQRQSDVGLGSQIRRCGGGGLVTAKISRKEAIHSTSRME